MHLPNVTNIFSENTNRKNYSTLLNGKIIIDAKLDITKLLSKSELAKKTEKLDIEIIIKKFRKHITTFHQLMSIKQHSSNSISIIYKQVNMFYSHKNIAQFIKSYINKYEDDINKKELSILFEPPYSNFLT